MPEIQRTPELTDAICGLRGWRLAGESHANRGGSLTPLDWMVQTALDELEWLHSNGKGISILESEERPSRERLQKALAGIEENFEDDLLGDDLRVIHAALTGSKKPASCVMTALQSFLARHKS